MVNFGYSVGAIRKKSIVKFKKMSVHISNRCIIFTASAKC